MESIQEDVKPTAKPKRWPKRVGISSAVIVLVLFALPELIRFGVVYWLNEQPQIQEVNIKDVDLNFFTGEVGLTGLALSGDGQSSAKLEKVSINLKISSLFQQRIDIESFELSGLVLDVQQNSQEQTIIAGINLSNGQPSDTDSVSEVTENKAEMQSSWGVGIQRLSVSDIAINVLRPDLETTLVLTHLNLGVANTWAAEQATPMDVAMVIHGAPLTMTGHIHPFTDQVKAKLQLELQQLPLSLFAGIAAQQGIERLAGALSIHLGVDVVVGGESNITSAIELANFTLTQAPYDVAFNHLKWQGDFQHHTPRTEADFGIRAQGSIGLRELQVLDTIADMSLLKLTQLDITHIELKEALKTTIKRIQVQDIVTIAQADESLIQLAAIDLQKIMYDGKTTLKIDSLDLSGLIANIQLNAAGEIALLNTLSRPSTEAQAVEPTTISAVEEPKPQTNEPNWRVQLGQFQVTENSQIRFNDQSVSPAYNANIQPFDLRVNDIDTGAPEQDISITLAANINELTLLSMDATVRPFNEHINMSAKGELKNLDMPPLSPYALAASGYYLKRGLTDAKFEATVVDDALDSVITLKLNKFKLKAGDPEKAKTLNDNLTIPLDLALNILRDKKDNIELDIKIDGNINDPQFDASQVINKALGNAAKFAAVYVLKQSLQPWGTVYSIGSYLGKKVTTPRFDSVVFPAGTNELSEDQLEYMDKLAGLLVERPVLSLNLCASASEKDRLALTPPAPAATDKTTEAPDSAEEAEVPAQQVVVVSNLALLELANARMDQVKKQLIDKGVDTGRLFSCQPTIDKMAKAEPVVELFL